MSVRALITVLVGAWTVLVGGQLFTRYRTDFDLALLIVFLTIAFLAALAAAFNKTSVGSGLVAGVGIGLLAMRLLHWTPGSALAPPIIYLVVGRLLLPRFVGNVTTASPDDRYVPYQDSRL